MSETLLAIVCFCFLITCYAQNKITVDWKSGHNDLSCRSNQVPCHTLDYALNISTNNTVISIYSGIQFMEDNAVIADVMNVSIVGSPIGTHIKCNHVDIGIMIVRVMNLTIANISLFGCGSLHDSTVGSSKDNIISAIYIIKSTNLIIENATIKDNNGTNTGLAFGNEVTSLLYIQNHGSIGNSKEGEETVSLSLKRRLFSDHVNYIFTSSTAKVRSGLLAIIIDTKANDNNIAITNDKSVNSKFEMTSDVKWITGEGCTCHPGYICNNSNNTCICSVSTTTPIPGILGCDELKEEAMMKLGYWAGCNETDGILITAQCPLGYCNYNNEDQLFYLRKDCNDLEQHMCTDNRQGRLCGECKQNYSVHYHSQRFKCGECTSPYSSLGWLFYILSEIVPLTLLFVFVIFFDISFTSGAVNSFLLFAQVLDFYQVTAFNSYMLPECIEVLIEIYWFFFGFFNMDFFRLDNLSFCLWEEAKVLDVLAFKYVTTAYGLFLILFLFLLLKYCNCGKLRKCFGSNTRDGQYSTIHGITSFLIITYSQCAKVSFQILTQENLVKAGNELVHTVVFLSGQTKFFGKDHLKYAIPAMFVISFIILLPLLLIVHPLYYTVKRFLINKRIIKDEIGNRYWLSQKCTFMIAKINLFFKPTLDAFQSCFKDDMRWYAGLYFVCRLLISAAFAFTTTALSMYTLLEVIVVCMLAIHSVCQPYQKRFYNILDSLMLANLGIINGISLFNFAYTQFLTVHGVSFNTIKATVIIQLILIYLPIVYAVVFAVYKLFSKCRSIAMKIKLKRKIHLDDEQGVNSLDNGIGRSFNPENLPNRMFEDEKLREEELARIVEPGYENRTYGAVANGQ